MKIALFATCLADTLFPNVARATVLERLGHTVEFPAAQTEDVPAFVELESGGPPPVACQVGKSADVVPGFMIRLGEGADSFGLLCGRGLGGGARPSVGGSLR